MTFNFSGCPQCHCVVEPPRCLARRPHGLPHGLPAARVRFRNETEVGAVATAVSRTAARGPPTGVTPRRKIFPCVFRKSKNYKNGLKFQIEKLLTFVYFIVLPKKCYWSHIATMVSK